MSLPWSGKGSKATPVAADELMILDSEDANPSTQNKRILLSSITGVGEVNTSSNSGSGLGLALAKVGVDLPFKSVIGQLNKITLTSNASDITFTLGTDVVTTDQSNTFGDFAQIFPDNQFFIQNPAATFEYQFIASAITLDRTVTLPLLISNDTFVFENHIQTLTNKTLDSSNSINALSIDSGTLADARLSSNVMLLDTAQENTGAKQFRDNTFELRDTNNLFDYHVRTSVLAADRDITIPILAANDIFVFESATQTLTNKTLTTPTIASFTNATHDHTNAAGGGTIAISDTTGTLTVSRGGTNLTALGTALQILRVNAGGTVLEYATNPSGDAQTSDPLSQFASTSSAQLLSIMSNPTGTGLLVFNDTPTLLTPTIGSFVNAAHDHENAAGGGQLTATDALDATGTPTASNFLRGDNTWGTPAGGGDMVLADVQTNTGAKTFLDTTMLLRNVANTFSSQFTNTNTAARTYTLQDSSDTLMGRATTDTFTNKTFDANATGNSLSNIDIADHSATGAPSASTFYRGDNTWSTPAGAGDMVLADVQTVTGAKTFADNAFLIQNPAITFEYLFQGGAIVADRTITLPVLTGNDTLVFEAHTQTLTNKTIDGDLNTIIDINETQMDVSVGASGTVLTSNGTGVPPTYQTAGSASLPVPDTTSIAEGSVDNTKEVRFEVDGNTTGIVGVLATAFTTAKTITFPDATDTLVGLATTDNLTNKTLTSAILTTPDLNGSILTLDVDGDLTLSAAVDDELLLTVPDDTVGGLRVGSTDGSLFLGNGSAVANTFAPTIQGRMAGATIQTFFDGIVLAADDTGTVPLINIRGFRDTFAQVTNRPIMSISNFDTALWTIDNDGTVDIHGNTMILDADGDLTLDASTDDIATFTIPVGITPAGLSIGNVDGSIEIINGLAGSGNFSPQIRGTAATANNATFIDGAVPPSGDTGTEPLLFLRAYQDDLTPITSRAILQIGNFLTKIWEIDNDGTVDQQGNDLVGVGTASLIEQAAANPDVAGSGQWWVQTATPNIPMFTNDAGTDFQLATLTGTETLTNKTLDDETNLVIADASHLYVRNQSGVTMSKGDAVYISGYNIGQDKPEITLADSSGTSTMPAIGLVFDSSLPNGTNGVVCVTGRMASLDTSSFSAGDELYVSETAGAFTNVKPTVTALIQKIGTVLRSHATLGVVQIDYQFADHVDIQSIQTVTGVKTFTTPVIASFVNAAHDHENAAGGGQLTATDALDATGTPDATTFLRGDNTWATPAGSGDMILAGIQTVTGAKTFLDTTLLLRNVANSFNGSFLNTNTADRIYTLPDEAGTISLIGRTETLVGKTLTTPTIVTGGFTNMNHDHSAAAEGGLVAISDTTGTLTVNRGGTNLTALGAALQVLRVNAGATALEYATIAAGGDMVLADVQTSSGKKTFPHDGTASGLSLGAIAGNPSTPVEGDVWYNGTTDRLHYEATGSSQEMVSTAASQTLTNKTLTTPTIASFVNATHDHTNAAGGGTLLSTSALSDTANIAYLNTANTFGSALTQTFTHAAGGAGIGLAAVAGDVTAPNDGEFWYNSTTDKFRVRENGATVDMIGSAGEVNTASNVGAGVGVFDQKSGVDLEFNSLIGGTGIDVTDTVQDITIAIDATVAQSTDTLDFFANTTSAELASVISDETGSGLLVFGTSPALTTPVLGTPTSGVLTNCTGTASGLTAGNVTTNANLTGDVTSVGNATSIGSGVIVDADINASAAIAVTKLENDARTVNITMIIDGGGSAITTGIKGDLQIDFPCTIQQVTMLADQTGSIVVDIWKDTFANFPATNADSITASAVPTISSSDKSQDVTLTGWTTTISDGDHLRFNVDSVTSIERVTVSLEVLKT